MSKELTGVVEVVFGNKILLVGFKYGLNKDLISYQLTVLIVELNPNT